jgi:hypothetical protein
MRISGLVEERERRWPALPANLHVLGRLGARLASDQPLPVIYSGCTVTRVVGRGPGCLLVVLLLVLLVLGAVVRLLVVRHR